MACRSDDPEEPTRDNLVQIKTYDGSSVVIDILVRKDICKVIANRIRLQNEVQMPNKHSHVQSYLLLFTLS